jgi:hypothetical protein
LSYDYAHYTYIDSIDAIRNAFIASILLLCALCIWSCYKFLGEIFAVCVWCAAYASTIVAFGYTFAAFDINGIGEWPYWDGINEDIIIIWAVLILYGVIWWLASLLRESVNIASKIRRTLAFLGSIGIGWLSANMIYIIILYVNAWQP